jgi:hypothetical protein
MREVNLQMSTDVTTMSLYRAREQMLGQMVCSWLLRNARKSEVPSTLKDWLKNPVENWDLPILFLEDVKNKLKYS